MDWEAGVVPNSVLLPISEDQCPVLRFLQEATYYPDYTLHIDVPERALRSREVLSGRVFNTSGGHVTLLAIDDEGRISDVTDTLTVGADDALTLSPALAPLLPYTAEFFFALLTGELEQRGTTAEAAMVGFTVTND